ncbi:MAG: acyl--CoA ligase [Actinomycetaceae bacterium]|nr:acyl--CoA ligase [Actinomycetaceae bacterium]
MSECITDIALCIDTILDRTATLYPQRVCAIDDGRTIVAAQAAYESRRLAQLLLAEGVKPGDSVVFASPNTVYHFFFLVACARIGAAFSPISTSLTPHEMKNLIHAIQPKVVVASVEVARYGVFDSQGDVRFFVLDDSSHVSLLSHALKNGYIGLSGAVNQFDGMFSSLEMTHEQKEECPLLLFTVAGEASSPHIIPVTHSQLWWAGRNMRDEEPYNAYDVFLAIEDLATSVGLNAMVIDMFVTGVTVVIARDSSAHEALKLIDKYSPTILCASTYFYRELISSHASHPSLSSIRISYIVGLGGAQGLISSMMRTRLNPQILFLPSIVPGALSSVNHQNIKGCTTSCLGYSMPYVKTRVVDESGSDVAPGESGELLVSGPCISQTYWESDFYTDEYVEGAWLRTGYIVENVDNSFVFSAFVPHTVVSGNRRIDVREIEHVVAQHPKIKEVAIAPVKDESLGFILIAAIVCERDDLPTIEELHSFCAGYIADYKIPRLLIALPYIPVNAAGATDYRKISALASSSAVPEPVSAPITQTIPIIRTNT